MRSLALAIMVSLLAACASTPTPAAADGVRCDALAGPGWQRTIAPDVGEELLALAHIANAPGRVGWYADARGARAACLPPAHGECGHALHVFQPQVHRMWGWSDGNTRREDCPG